MFHVSFRTLSSFTVALAISGLTWAHTESAMAKLTPPHGGLLADVGGYHVELVLQPDRVQVYVNDHLDKPVNIEGVTGTANLRVKGKITQQVPLQVVENRLEGPAAIPADAPVTVMIMFNIGGAQQMAPYVWPAGGSKSQPAGQ